MSTKTIRIPVIMDALGRWAASHSSEHENDEPDWDWIDEMVDHDKPPINPQRFWVTVEVPIPGVFELAGKCQGDGTLESTSDTLS